MSNNCVDVIAKESVKIENSPYFGLDIDHLTLFVKPIPTKIYKHEIK